MTTLRAVTFALVALCSRAAIADDLPTQQAAAHFDRGVSLYNETDYRAALVEFKKAYEIAPNPGVLYNLGQTYFQLQNYAAALTTFRQFVREAGENPHKAEVEQYIKTLEARVGKVQITTTTPAEITIDDESVGKTPLAAPIDVSIGHRKVMALVAGKPAETRYVDVATGETVKVDISITAEPAAPPLQPSKTPAGPVDKEPKPSHARVILWSATGALAAGAGVTGALAWKSSSDLDKLKKTFPTTPDALDAQASRTKNLSLASDILTGAAILTGCAALYVTLTHKSSKEVHAGLTPTGVIVGGAF